MKIIVALDSFKGSCSAEEACSAVEQGILSYNKDINVVKLPISDGGEGLIDALIPTLGAAGYRTERIEVTGPYLKNHPCVLLIKDEHCIIEMAQCAGLTLEPAATRRALNATTFGLGQAVNYALSIGCRRFSIGLGGSATNDGGAGFVQALGGRFFDREGHEILRPVCGRDLPELSRVDAGHLNPQLRSCSFTGTCDVANPLLGPNGATYIFGPQKGLQPGDLELLEHGMEHYAKLLGEAGREFCEMPGAGAAGGLGFALLWSCGAKLKSGIDEVLDLLGIDELLPDADLVVVGEGRMDSQSCQGKAPVGVARRAKRFKLPVVAVCGGITDDATALYDYGIDAMFSICPRPLTLAQSMEQGGELLTRAAHNLIRFFACAGGIKA